MINFLSGAGKKMPVRGHVCNIYIYTKQKISKGKQTSFC